MVLVDSSVRKPQEKDCLNCWIGPMSGNRQSLKNMVIIAIGESLKNIDKITEKNFCLNTRK